MKSVNTLREKGFDKIEHQLKLLQSEEYAAEFSKLRGLSPEFLNVLIKLGKLFLSTKQWWFANNSRRKYSNILTTLLQGKTKATRCIDNCNLHIQVDKPSGLFMIIDNAIIISGWAINLTTISAAKVRIRIGNTVYKPELKQRDDLPSVLTSKYKPSLNVGFSVSAPLTTGLHRMWIDVKGTNGTWVPFHRSFLFSLPQIIFRRQKQKISYKSWNRIQQKQLKAELPDISRHINIMIHKPTFTVIIDVRQKLDNWEETVKTIRMQFYPHFDSVLLVNEDLKLPGALGNFAPHIHETSLNNLTGEFIVFIECGQNLSNSALYEFANAINQYPVLDLIYGDEDYISTSGEHYEPFYKPDWSPDYLETFNYIGYPACFRATVARDFLNYTNLYDFTLKFTEQTNNIYHVPKIIGHTYKRKTDNIGLNMQRSSNISALQGRLQRTGRNGIILEHKLYRGSFDIELALKETPLVSIVIPTAGKTITVENIEIDLITKIIDQIHNKSTYKNIEIIVIDNGDLTETQKQTLETHDCQQLTFSEPVFNISKKLNLGASVATGKFLLLMNDDIEILNPSWIERMIEHFEKPHVGVVGAKLLYSNGNIQHTGIVHNNGQPYHVRRFFSGDESGYFFSTNGVRNYMAVTGAVMMTTLSIFRQVGGYSEELGVSYNDVDYCLKVQECGLWSVYAPKVKLTHMESSSRVSSVDAREVTWFETRWAPHLVFDPYYNEQFLTVAPPTFVPCINQRVL